MRAPQRGPITSNGIANTLKNLLTNYKISYCIPHYHHIILTMYVTAVKTIDNS